MRRLSWIVVSGQHPVRLSAGFVHVSLSKNLKAIGQEALVSLEAIIDVDVSHSVSYVFELSSQLEGSTNNTSEHAHRLVIRFH